MNRFLFATLFSFLSLVSFGASPGFSITGVVSDSNTNAAIDMATVAFRSAGKALL